MKQLLSFLLCLLTLQGFAQIDTTPPYKKFPSVPPLQLTQLNNELLTKEKLKSNLPVIIMFFSPDCDHCQHQMEAMIARMKDLSKYQIVLATHEPANKLAQFRSRYHLEKYPNIVMGTDTKFLLPPFYRIRNFPYLALYNSKGNLVTTYEGNVQVDKMLEAFSADAKGKKTRVLVQ